MLKTTIDLAPLKLNIDAEETETLATFGAKLHVEDTDIWEIILWVAKNGILDPGKTGFFSAGPKMFAPNSLDIQSHTVMSHTH